ncbi:hypothetical protein I4U23_006806 [Adineta vaga]|nr:hypothetical protein I4U23_006806 [Adineta vaga]
MAEATLNYQSIRTTHAVREADDLRIENRKRNLIVLVLQWLAEEGYIESARELEHETNLDVSKYDVCDNIGLDTILQEYESYFYVKFNRYPKLTKKIAPTAAFTSKLSAKLASAQSTSRRSNVPSLPRVINNGTEVATGTVQRPPTVGEVVRKLTQTRKLNRSNSEKSQTNSISHSGSQQQSGIISTQHSVSSVEEMALSFVKVSSVKTTSSLNEQPQNGNKKKYPTAIIDCRTMLNDTLRGSTEAHTDPSDRLLKPLGGFTGYNSEWRELAEVVSRSFRHISHHF